MWNLLGLVFPGLFKTIDGITSAIANERIAALSATTDRERIAAEERMSALQVQRDALVAEANRSKLPIYIQSLIGLAAASILLKYITWDKVIGSFMGCVGKNTPLYCKIYTTDPLDQNMWWVITAVVGFYFLTSIFRK